MRIIGVSRLEDLKRLMQELGVDPYGIRIMAPKAITRVVRINSLSCIAANILKQEMLSLGADAALPRDVLTGKLKHTPCLLIGSLSQFSRLNAKLKLQPFGLTKVSAELSLILANFQLDKFFLDLGRYKLSLGRPVRIMGILNLTPDSFSGDGLYRAATAEVTRFAEKLVEDGADILDLGGESSRPGAKPVSLKEELSRIIPAIKEIAKKIKKPISVDTYKPAVAEAALSSGASIVNDITGLRDARMAKIIARHKAAVVIMHMKANPRTMQKNPVYKSLADEVMEFLQQAVERAISAGISKEKIIIDPGIGFGKTLEHNLELLKNLSQFKALGRPILVGPSRKSFIGKILARPPQERISGTIAACVLALRNGAAIVRVHDVREVSEALNVAEAISNQREKINVEADN